MHILNKNSDMSMGEVTLYLTYSEALELKDSLEELLKKPSSNHSHISSEDFQKELTICIYDTNNLNGFNKRSVQLILNDE